MKDKGFVPTKIKRISDATVGKGRDIAKNKELGFFKTDGMQKRKTRISFLKEILELMTQQSGKGRDVAKN